MEEESNYKVDLDELIFAKKNKAYGAYKLRKSYKKYLSIGMWTAIVFFILLTYDTTSFIKDYSKR